MNISRRLVVLVVACSVLAACAPGPGTASPGGGGSGSQPRTAPKRIVAGIQDDIPIVYQKLNPSSRYRGVEAVQDMVSAFGPVGSIAAQIGVPMNETAAAMAALTRNGYDASRAATQVQDASRACAASEAGPER